MGAFDGELYSLGYRFNSSKDEPTKPKEERLPAVSKHTLLELLKKHNIQIPERFGSGDWKYIVCDRYGCLWFYERIPKRDGNYFWESFSYYTTLQLKKPSSDWDKVVITVNGYINNLNLNEEGYPVGFYNVNDPSFTKDNSKALFENYYNV